MNPMFHFRYGSGSTKHLLPLASYVFWLLNLQISVFLFSSKKYQTHLFTLTNNVFHFTQKKKKNKQLELFFTSYHINQFFTLLHKFLHFSFANKKNLILLHHMDEFLLILKKEKKIDVPKHPVSPFMTYFFQVILHVY
jgi:hypothetical protein